MSSRTCFIFLLTFVGFFAGVLHGQNDACLLRTTLISVAGKNGEPAEGLTAANFRATVGGKAAFVQAAIPAAVSPRVVILLDTSAKHDPSTWAATQGMVEEFLAQFHGPGDFTLVTFDDKVQQVVHQTDRGALQGTVAEMFPSGKRESEAGLAEAIKIGSASFDTHRAGDAEFLITTSDQIRKETEQALSQQRVQGIRFFGASFDQSRRYGPDRFGVGMTIEDYSPLEAAARASGGGWIWFDMSSQNAASSLRSAVTAGKSTAAQVRHYLVIELRLESPITKPEKLKIELLKAAKGKAQERFTTHPQELFPCQ